MATGFAPAPSSSATSTPEAAVLLSKILRWIAYPVEPFSFGFFLNGLSPSALDGDADGLGKAPGLLDDVRDGAVNDLSYLHRMDTFDAIGRSEEADDPPKLLISRPICPTLIGQRTFGAVMTSRSPFAGKLLRFKSSTRMALYNSPSFRTLCAITT